jgi:thiol-disulfide isomerase/thioredoxin/mono/diheme cytochrome c family protein
MKESRSMKTLAIVLFAALAAPAFAAEPVHFPRLLDSAGQPRSIGEMPKVQAVAFVFLGPECPLCQRYAPTLNAIARGLPKGVEFYGIVSGSSVTRAEAAKYAADYKLNFPVLFDGGSELASLLKPTHVPEAFVLKPTGEQVYRGRIDDWYEAPGKPKATVQSHDLKDAIATVAAGKPVANAVTKPIGCHFEDEILKPGESPAKVTYNRHIAAILRSQCADCHRPGEVAPFSLLSFKDAGKRGHQLNEMIAAGTMPPWKAERNYGHFLGERRLTAAEKATFAKWVKSGMEEGDAADALAPAKYSDGWQLGKPDLVIKMPEAFTIPGSGPDIVRNFVVPLPALTDDRMVTCIEIRPGNRKVVHHAICYLDTTGAARKLDAADAGPGYESYKGGLGFLPTGALGGFAPGNVPRHVPEGMGRYLPKGADAVLQLHYHPSGKEEKDQTEVGVYFAKKPVTNVLFGIAVENWEIDIPAGAKGYQRNSEYTLPVDVTFTLVAPHMHRLGTEMKCWAELPNGEKRPMVHVKKWDFNQQDGYFYREPFTLPKGTKLKMESWFDNPGKERVVYGERTENEMSLCVFEVHAKSLPDLFTVLADQLRTQKIVERFTEPAKPKK